MKLFKIVLLFSVLFMVGCGDSGGGAAGDANDPVISGSDEEQANEADGAVDVTTGGRQ